MEPSGAQWPHTVRLAIALSIAGLLVGFINTFRFWDSLQARDGAFYAFAQVAIPVIIFLALLAFVARRQNWARIVFVTLCFLAMPGYVFTLYGRAWGLTELLQLINGLCFLASAILLLVRQSHVWFRREANAT